MSPWVDVLFGEYLVYDLIGRQRQAMRSEVANAPSDYILGVDPDEYLDQLVDKYKLDAPIIKVAGVEDMELAFREDTVTPRGVDYPVRAKVYTVKIEFEGASGLLKCRPSTMRPIRGCDIDVVGNVIEITCWWENPKPDDVRKTFLKIVEAFKINTQNLAADFKPFNETLREKAKAVVKQRRAEVKRDAQVLQEVGFPLKRRDKPPAGLSVSVKRRAPKIVKPSASRKKVPGEPFLDSSGYEDILTVIRDMATVMEYSPAAFRGMKEEHLRFVFLVGLNATYRGQATGETFNFQGDTDILIKVDGRNIFVGECKFWDGPKSLTDAVDQLLGYTSWHDTKTAILLFNRRKDFSAVLEKIPDAVLAHPNVEGQLKGEGESTFRFRLHHKDDKDRKMTLTVVAFEVPE